MVKQQRARLETTDVDLAKTGPQIEAHWERQKFLEPSAAEATVIPSQRRAVHDGLGVITVYARDATEFLKGSELPERRAIIETFIKDIVVMPGRAIVQCTVPMAGDSHMPGADSEEIPLGGSVTSAADDVQGPARETGPR